MRTSKPISSISYNTEEHLRNVLEELYRNHVISDYMYIYHFKEEDEAKDHWHIWIEPNRMLDTMGLQEKFKELDLSNPTKPLGVINFQSSKTDDWILYVMHFEPYLLSKGQSRKYHYTKDDFKYADEMTFEERFNHALYGSEWAANNQRIEWLKSGKVKPLDLIMSGAVPVQMASAMASLDRLMTNRNGRESHTPIQHSWKPKQEDRQNLKAEQATMFDGFVPADDIQF